MKHDGAHTRERRTDGCARRGAFRDRRVNDPVAAELPVEVLHARSGVPGTPQTLTEYKHPWIRGKELCVRLSDSVCVGNRPHVADPSLADPQTCLVKSLSPGYGDSRAKATAASISWAASRSIA